MCIRTKRNDELLPAKLSRLPVPRFPPPTTFHHHVYGPTLATWIDASSTIVSDRRNASLHAGEAVLIWKFRVPRMVEEIPGLDVLPE